MSDSYVEGLTLEKYAPNWGLDHFQPLENLLISKEERTRYPKITCLPQQASREAITDG